MMWCGAYNSFGDSRVYYKDLVGSAKLLTGSPDDTRGEDIKVNGPDIYIAGWIRKPVDNEFRQPGIHDVVWCLQLVW